MAVINEIMDELTRAAAQDSPDSVIARRVGVFGSTGLLSQRFAPTDSRTDAFYGGAEFGFEVDPATVPVIYGRKVLVAAQGVDGGQTRSQLDPERIQRVLRLRIGEGPIGGIIGEAGTTEQLQSTFINCTPVVNDDGTANFFDIILASAAGSAIPYLFSEVGEAALGVLDPVLGTPIGALALEADPNKDRIRLTDLDDVEAGGSCKDMILVSDGECGWQAKHFNQALLDAGMTADGVTAVENVGSGKRVYKVTDGTVAKLRTLVAGTGVTITEDADTITISATGGGGSPSGDPLNDHLCTAGVCMPNESAVFGEAGETRTYRWDDGGGTTLDYTGGHLNVNFTGEDYKVVRDASTGKDTADRYSLWSERLVKGDRCQGFAYGECPAGPVGVSYIHPLSGAPVPISFACDPCSPGTPPVQPPKYRTVTSTDGGVAVRYTATTNTTKRFTAMRATGGATYATDATGVYHRSADHGTSWTNTGQTAVHMVAGA